MGVTMDARPRAFEPGQAAGLEGDDPRRGKVLLGMAAVAGVTVLDVICGRRSGRDRIQPEGDR